MRVHQGAEAVVIEQNGTCTKARRTKRYRIPRLDAMLRKRRTRSEARLLRAALRAGVRVPRVLAENESELVLEKIESLPVKALLDVETALIAPLIGESVAQLHGADIVHGDLTTSNMLFDGSLYVIDFGLSFFSKRPEDKANDLYAMEQALAATHPGTDAMPIILKAYREKYAEAGRVLHAWEKIRTRRRYA